MKYNEIKIDSVFSSSLRSKTFGGLDEDYFVKVTMYPTKHCDDINKTDYCLYMLMMGDCLTPERMEGVCEEMERCYLIALKENKTIRTYVDTRTLTKGNSSVAIKGAALVSRHKSTKGLILFRGINKNNSFDIMMKGIFGTLMRLNLVGLYEVYNEAAFIHHMKFGTIPYE